MASHHAQSSLVKCRSVATTLADKQSTRNRNFIATGSVNELEVTVEGLNIYIIYHRVQKQDVVVLEVYSKFAD